MKASGELDNLLEVSEYMGNEVDGKDGHIYKNNVGGFDYYKTLFKVGNNFFEGIINIEITKYGRQFKDITKIKDVTEGDLDQLKNFQKSNASITSSKNSIPLNFENDNGNILNQVRDINETFADDTDIRYHSRNYIHLEDGTRVTKKKFLSIMNGKNYNPCCY